MPAAKGAAGVVGILRREFLCWIFRSKSSSLWANTHGTKSNKKMSTILIQVVLLHFNCLIAINDRRKLAYTFDRQFKDQTMKNNLNPVSRNLYRTFPFSLFVCATFAFFSAGTALGSPAALPLSAPSPLQERTRKGSLQRKHLAKLSEQASNVASS